jgi:hypothetical protein
VDEDFDLNFERTLNAASDALQSRRKNSEMSSPPVECAGGGGLLGKKKQITKIFQETCKNETKAAGE